MFSDLKTYTNFSGTTENITTYYLQILYGQVFSEADKIFTDINPSAAPNLLSAGSCTSATGNGVPYKASCSYDYGSKIFSEGQLVAPSWEQDNITPPREGDAASGYLTCYTDPSDPSCPVPTTATITADGQSSETVNPGTTINLSAVSNGTGCAITNPDSQTPVGVSAPYSSNITLSNPGAYTWTLSCNQAYPSGGAYTGCYTSSAYTNSSDLFIAPPITSQVTVTVTGQPQTTNQNILHVQAYDLATGKAISAQVAVDDQPAEATPFDFTTSTNYNENLSLSTQNQPIKGTQYTFDYWTFPGTNVQRSSSPTQISLNPQDSPRTAIAWFSTANPNGNPQGGNGGNNNGGTPTNWYYCLQGQNACTISQPYPDEPTCEAAVNQWHGPGSTLGVASSYTCYQTSSACSAATTCSTTPPIVTPPTPPATSTCTGSGCPTVTLSAFPTTINYGQSSGLTWTSTDADSCTAKPDAFNVGGTNGYQFVSGGSKNGSARAFPTNTTTYDFTCSNSNGSAKATATVTVRPLGCVGASCAGSTGPGDISITNFIINNKNAPSLPSALACIPDHSSNGINNDIVSWSATAVNSCGKGAYVPPTGSDCNGPWDWTPTPTPNLGSCSIMASNGWSSGNVSFTNQGHDSFSPATPQLSTDYTLSCTRNQYTCTWRRPDWQLVYSPPSIPGGVGSSACKNQNRSIPYQASVPASTASLSNTLVVVQPPTISGFAPNRANILINQGTSLNWNYYPNSSDSSSQKVATFTSCYSGGVSAKGDSNGWSATQANPFTGESGNSVTVPVSPKTSTTYDLICQSAYIPNKSCYATATDSASVNVFNTNLQETGPSSFLEPMNRLLGDVLGVFKSSGF